MPNAANEKIYQAADALRAARESRTPIDQISKKFGIDNMDSAYQVAAINTQHRLENGERIIGKKVGLTSKAVQKQLGVDQPDFGVLFENMEYLDGSDIPLSRLIQPKAEAEVAFVVGKNITHKNPTWSEFVNAIEYALPAIEIVDSAIEDWKLTLADTVADNASCGVYVLGNQPVSLGNLSLGELGMKMECNGEVVSVGSGVACLGHPLRAAYWLAQMMTSREEGLYEGEIILSGALGPMIPLVSGNIIQADMGPLGTVSCRIVEE